MYDTETNNAVQAMTYLTLLLDSYELRLREVTVDNDDITVENSGDEGGAVVYWATAVVNDEVVARSASSSVDAALFGLCRWLMDTDAKRYPDDDGGRWVFIGGGL